MSIASPRDSLSEAAPAGRFEHPVRLEGLLDAADAATMVGRALGLVDERLVDHGLRVARMLDAMMEVDGSLDERQRDGLHMAALLHDVGAYRTEEIDRLVSFETGDVWEHSFYGCLFYKELSPLPEYAEIILYHHMPNSLFDGQDAAVRFLSQCLQVADRADVLLLDRPELDADELLCALKGAAQGRFSDEAVALFAEAVHRFDLVKARRSGFEREFPMRVFRNGGEAVPYLDMLVHVIDFRSRHTVAHTVTTAWTAYGLAVRMLADDDAVRRVYLGALLHDVGKIGVPLSVLEKPGRLDEAETAVMRTHVKLTERILCGLVDDDVLQVAVRHHEKLDGSGYPCGLRGDRLTMPERIVAVADIVSALVGTRSYKEAYPKDKVLEILSDQSERGLVDASVVQVMVRDYDEIMEDVGRATAPIEATYRRVQDGYRRLLQTLGEAAPPRKSRTPNPNA